MDRPFINCIKQSGFLVVVLRGEIYIFHCKGTKIRAAIPFTNFLTKDDFYPNIRSWPGIRNLFLHHLSYRW
jgi:hypothetical protein